MLIGELLIGVAVFISTIVIGNMDRKDPEMTKAKAEIQRCREGKAPLYFVP